MSGDEKWTTVQRKKTKHQQLSGKRRYQWPASVVSYYVCNLPEGCSKQRLRKECCQFGRVVDVFISNKKSRSGETYGFVKYDDVKDKLMLERVLGKIKIGNRVLAANLERYDRNHREVKNTSGEQIGGGVNGNQHEVWGRLNWKTGDGIRNSEDSYAEILRRGTTPVKEEMKIEIGHFLPNYIEEWSSISLIGKAKDAETLDNLIAVLDNEDVPTPQLRFMGGLNAMMTFHDEDEAVVFNECLRNRFDIFEKIEHWRAFEWKQDRVITLKIYGVPPPLWGDEVFDKIGSKYGKVIRRTGADGFDANLAFKKVRILTSNFESVDEVCSIHWGKSVFRCRVKESDEEWLPDFVRHQEGIIRSTASPVNPVGQTAEISSPSSPTVVGRNGNEILNKDLGDVDVEGRTDEKSTSLQERNSVPEKVLSLVSGDNRSVCSLPENRVQEVNDGVSLVSFGPVKVKSPKQIQEMFLEVGLGSNYSDGSVNSRRGPDLNENRSKSQLVSSGPVLRSRSRLGGSQNLQASSSSARAGKKGKGNSKPRIKDSSPIPNKPRKFSNQDDLEIEVEETIKMGNCVGVSMIDDEGKVAEVIVGDNYTCF
ncbi:hypothetical protein SSX86_030144 [Deinandra increscens subsp. villosa]|uniref:RRM domain-containing protein n=1 Tax=Deinandra increscens subsp. villosa TaxID=3103831 RepID=A0AAP0CGB7_9ASTR